MTRWWIGLVTLVAVVVSAFVSFAVGLVLALATCDGDGGVPYSAPDSTAGRFCASPASAVYFCVQIGLPALTILVLGVVATIQMRWTRLAVGVLGAGAVVVIMAMVVVAMPTS